ncbi:MAG: hypothetical protein JOZ32_20845 [Bryobacterales bacterium]|nr:hypothetical protein [Bryobacterales bacterium]
MSTIALPGNPVDGTRMNPNRQLYRMLVGVLLFSVLVAAAFFAIAARLAPTHTQASGSDADATTSRCSYVYLATRDEKASDLTMNDVRMIRTCDALGLYSVGTGTVPLSPEQTERNRSDEQELFREMNRH